MSDSNQPPAPGAHQGKQWPANVPGEAEAAKMLTGLLPAGEYQSVVTEFLSGLSPLEKGALQLAGDPLLVTALAVRWKLAAAIAVAPVWRFEVDLKAVDALAQEAEDAAFGLASGPGMADATLKPLYEANRAALKSLGERLKHAVPKDQAPAVQDEQKPAAFERKAAAPEPAKASGGGQAPVPDARQQSRQKGLLVLAVAVALVGVVVHGARYATEQSALAERRAKEAALPSEFTSGKVTAVNLREATPEKLAELEERAQREGKRLLRITPTEFQLVAEGPGAAPTPPPPAPPPAPPTPAADTDGGAP